ncbi:MAG TPA: type II toxin-antitoxin system prevent-host-death family antitoxin [Gammaproteobacteria bacterium]|nr:type II toxin-antitoxin system prevent-host-death family antitoxin [Gammaproteobacteria bacterium]
MIRVTSVEAQNRFGELIDKSLREPVEVTRRGRTVAYVISGEDMRELMAVRKRREETVRWYSHYRDQVTSHSSSGNLPDLTDADANELVHELR